jgi:hypothetical protein
LKPSESPFWVLVVAVIVALCFGGGYFIPAIFVGLPLQSLVFYWREGHWPTREYLLKRKRIEAATWPSPLVHDSRRPIVYLRSFQDDSTTGKIPPRLPFGYSEYSYAYSYGLRLRTEEEDLAAVMNEVGPFTAIGRPGEKLPELGAYRIYVAHDQDWQEEVRKRMLEAQLVVIRLGGTEGVLWELKTAIELVEPERLLLLVPWEKRQYEKFRTESAKLKLFPAGLPAYGASKWFPGNPGSLHGIICFWSGWTPHFLPCKHTFDYNQAGRASLKKTLIPVFNRLGLAYKPL